MIQIVDARGKGDWTITRSIGLEECEAVVRPIVEAVRRDGDEALLRFARQLDGLGEREIRVEQREMEEAEAALKPDVRAAIKVAIRNIREFAEAQLPRDCLREFSPGRKLGWIVRPLDAVGCYVPSGRYPLPSTLLMTAVLAQTAGVKRICVMTPKPSQEILGCAEMLGVREVYRVGGAQAIAAMAFGTESVGRVDRIVGPGNAYVAASKKMLAGEVGIDFVAGPTEIMIVALDEDSDASLVAADMLAQAEHDITASAILVTTSMRLAQTVAKEIERQLETLPTAKTARQAIDASSTVCVVETKEQALRVVNDYAPEHLSLHDTSLLPGIQSAGTVFLGKATPESAGDYAAGPSHVLPTHGVARQRGGLSAADFVKVIAVQQLSRDALGELAPTITALARAEGLEAHARAVEVRVVN